MSKKKSKKLRAKSVSGIVKPTLKIKNIIIDGTFYAPSGYSSSTREFTHHFIKNYDDEFNIHLIDRQWDKIRMALHPKYKETIEDHMVRDPSVLKNLIPDETMILRWGIPTGFDYVGFGDVPHRIKALYFVWECDRLPPLWIDLLQYYDVIFTCSVSSRDAIEKSLRERGMQIPVIIIPHGVADHYYKIDNKVPTLDGFTFLSIGTFTKRKAPLEMIGSFIQEFSSEENVRLIWKVGNISNPSQMLTLRREIQKMAFKLGVDMTLAPKIILDMNTYDSDLLNEFYNESNCMIQVSHGEAWGLPILNGMATGTPALVLDKGGHKSFTNKKTSFFVKSGDLIYADGQNDWYANTHGVRWNSINLDDYRTQLRYVYEHSEEIKDKSIAGLEVAKRFSWNNVAKKAYKIFNTLNIQIPSRYERTRD